ncbi:dockerin type I repeat-containing protein [Ruminococcus sp.]|uniref:dockerin type I repeat-containing protein n=1 Tax=Ruminococcus sp. TaxID=41978 RepID=UPI0025CF45EC|nr:dockerin type I repeat-containing protein [Ruminococcus sp.]MCR4638598.1 dockerin type I repeat-containing protein [Ruminococcus sp.]
MRKFTKEISTLLAAVTVSASVNAVSVSSEESMRLSGQRTSSDTEIADITYPTDEDMVSTAGVDIAPVTTAPREITTINVGDPITATTTTVYDEEIPPLMGDVAPPAVTTTTIPPVAGGMMGPSTTTAEEIPPFMGTMTAATTTTVVTTTTTSEEEIPPLMGEVAYIPGDANGDFEFNVADIITLQRYILHMPDAKIYDWYQADMCKDGEINIFDLVVMRRELLKQMRYDAERVFDK